MSKIKAILALVSILMFSACHKDGNNGKEPAQPKSSNGQSLSVKPSSEVKVKAREVADKLTQQLAINRKARLSNISYDLDIDLVSLQDGYQGQVDVTFDLNDNKKSLSIDFTGGSVSKVTVNGHSIPVEYSGYFITFSAESLVVGTNKVSVTYSHPYGQDGTGLHRFVDPEDGETYLYTYLWPYYANRLFPNFDQPNLKATYEMKVRAQSDWQVVSAVAEDSIIEEGSSKVWHFPKSKQFSTYIFSLHAGPYHVWEDKAGDIPVRLMARKTLAEYVPVEEWMGYTKNGLTHFNDYFDIAYPFEKYDQIIVPDFNIGAMENVAAVTFTEKVLQRGPSSRFQRQRRADIILHEMAHMWFGNLVTKDWWNGLWLNESFATLMAAIAVSKIPEFSDFWHDFYLDVNLSAISADNQVSTHPIEVPVPSSDDFFAVFDAITYEKGASVLNQLSHFVGQENFRLGVSSYLKKHAWENTVLDDFINAQALQSGKELSGWSKEWLYQAGVNKVKVEFSCQAGKISEFKVLQSAPDIHPILRSQRTQLALLNLNEDKVATYHVTPITISGAVTEVKAVEGLECPYLAYPNYQGWGYAEVELDLISKDNAFDALAKLNDPLLRSMLWTSILDDSDTDLTRVIDAIKTESNDRIINQVQNSLLNKFNTLERQNHQGLEPIVSQFENLLWQLLSASTTDKNIKIISFNSFVTAVRSNQGIEHLIGLLENKYTLAELAINQEYRWMIIKRLAELGHPDVQQLIDNEKLKDPSDAGMLATIAAEAALPDMATKKKWLAVFMNNESPMPLSNQRQAMTSIFPANQVALQAQLLPELLLALPMIKDTRDNYYQRSYGGDLLNGICRKASLKQMELVLDKEKIGTTLYRFISENVQKAQKCVDGIADLNP